MRDIVDLAVRGVSQKVVSQLDSKHFVVVCSKIVDLIQGDSAIIFNCNASCLWLMCVSYILTRSFVAYFHNVVCILTKNP